LRQGHRCLADDAGRKASPSGAHSDNCDTCERCNESQRWPRHMSWWSRLMRLRTLEHARRSPRRLQKGMFRQCRSAWPVRLFRLTSGRARVAHYIGLRRTGVSLWVVVTVVAGMRLLARGKGVFGQKWQPSRRACAHGRPFMNAEPARQV
jgi:hypothetical protein